MKKFLFSTFVAMMLICFQSVGQTSIDVSNCSWITVSIIDGPDGLPVSDYEIGHGPDGYYLFFSDSNQTQLLMEGELENGLRQGLWKYYNSGSLYSSCNYANGRLNGLYEIFNPDGSVALSMQMFNDSPVENH